MERLLFFYIWAFSFLQVRNGNASLFLTSRMDYVSKIQKNVSDAVVTAKRCLYSDMSPLQRHATLVCQLVSYNYYNVICIYASDERPQ